MGFVEHQCRECGIGTIKLTTKSGRKTYHKGLWLEIPAHIQILTCDNCDSEWFDDTTAKLVDDALEELFQKEVNGEN